MHMLVRLFTIAIATLSLQVLPVLCLANLLEHPCDCSKPDQDCRCGHEQDCSSDPCAKILLNDGRSRSDDMPEAPSLVLPLPEAIVLDADCSGVCGCTESPLPFHFVQHYEALLPLLI